MTARRHPFTREELIRLAREVATRRGQTTISSIEFRADTGVGNSSVNRLFESWSAFCVAAGLQSRPRNERVSEEEVFAAARDALLAAGGVTTQTRFLRHFRYDRHVYSSRGLRWRQFLVRLRAWCEKNDPGFPYLGQLPAEDRRPVRGARPSQAAAATGRPPAPIDSGRTLGEYLGFRALGHAPVNELGVIFAFGVVAADLGFVLDMAVPGFPDGEARRRVRGGRYERVRIEFEHRASHFRYHAHDPAKCDLIVCWVDDWPESPVDVLELRAVVRGLMEKEAQQRPPPTKRVSIDGSPPEPATPPP